MIRRLLDITISILLIAILFPIALIVAWMIVLEGKGPVIFRQERVGQNLKKFKIFKFRTMLVNHRGDWITVGKDERLTKLGKKLRKYHIDEIPQLINILIGEMSLIGPRPLTTEAIEHHRNLWKKVLVIKPGITGLASARYALKEYKSLAKAKNPKKIYVNRILIDKIRLEMFYIKHRGLLLDCKIIIWTILKLAGVKL